MVWKGKKIIFIVALSVACSMLFGQMENDSLSRPLNNFSLNVLGEASIMSLNFERLFPLGKSVLLSAKIGLGANVDFCGLIQCEENYKSKLAITLPHHITANFGRGKAFFEIGYGGTYFLWNYNPVYLPSAIIGFRMQPLKQGKFVFRIFSQVPLVNSDSGLHYGDILFIPLGFSFGSSF